MDWVIRLAVFFPLGWLTRQAFLGVGMNERQILVAVLSVVGFVAAMALSDFLISCASSASNPASTAEPDPPKQPTSASD